MMKTTVLLSLILMISSANAAEKIVPLDMELGYWEITSELGESDMIREVLASMPEAQREQFRAMMESKMKLPIVKQCITKESLENMDKQLQESLGQQDQCDFKVVKSTNKELVGELNCTGNLTTIHTKVISSKRHEADVVSTVAEMGVTKLRTISVWKSDSCPAGVE